MVVANIAAPNAKMMTLDATHISEVMGDQDSYQQEGYSPLPINLYPKHTKNGDERDRGRADIAAESHD